MSYIDEAAREINVKIVWYSAVPGVAARCVRYIGDRTRPDLKRQQALDIGDGMTVTHLQFVPEALGTLRGFTTRFHLFAIERAEGGFEPDEARVLLFRGADGCVLVGGANESDALSRLDAALAGLGYAHVPIVYALDSPSAAGAPDPAVRGRTMGFPGEDSFVIDAHSGAGIFGPLKAMAKKILTTIAGNAAPSRETPPQGTTPLMVATSSSPNTIEAVQQGLDEYQRAFHQKAVWILGYEQDRLVPRDLPDFIPPHVVHVLRPSARDGVTAITNGISRAAPASGSQRVELRADAATVGLQISWVLSFLARLWYVQVRDGGAPWLPFDIVTTAERPIFGVSHFLLTPAGTVQVEGSPVSILYVWPISSIERNAIQGHIAGEARASWLAARGDMASRWTAVTERDQPFES
jgi:hypothetical protein